MEKERYKEKGIIVGMERKSGIDIAIARSGPRGLAWEVQGARCVPRRKYLGFWSKI